MLPLLHSLLVAPPKVRVFPGALPLSAGVLVVTPRAPSRLLRPVTPVSIAAVTITSALNVAPHPLSALTAKLIISLPSVLLAPVGPNVMLSLPTLKLP